MPLIYVLLFLIIVPLIYFQFKYGTQRDRKRVEFPKAERIRALIDKSARNGFIATWLALFIVVVFRAPDANSLLIVVAAGLAVYVASHYIYYFKSG